MTNLAEKPSSSSTSEKSLRKSLDSSNQTLRYPIAVVDERISSWLQSTAPAAMSARSETPSDNQSNLGDSTYEFIDTDEESRDGNCTESIASTDYGRPDDLGSVASLADTEQSDDESGSEKSHETGGIPAFTGLDDMAETPTIGQSAAVFLDDIDRPLTHSIEFEEPLNLGAENVSVKHTVADFNEEQTATIVERMMLHSPAQRLVATIRQTMTKQGLSTREPLRILYVGSHSAKQDIIHKIASSVAASIETSPRPGSINHRPSQIFNVVPVTAFGSLKTPEIELMHSSGYQIKVEDCLTAINLKFEDGPEKPDVIKLTLEENFSYHSVPEGVSFIVEPAWELPHVAILYCSDNDTNEMRRTRTFARTFMSRHRVPLIVISHKQLFDKTMGSMLLDQHAIHMCLESRDPNGPRSIIHQRLPIDLASFMNIDARQMNRNLAYLTGLHEPLKTIPSSMGRSTSHFAPRDIEKTSSNLSESVSFLRARTGAEWRALLPVGMLLLSVFATVLTGIYSYHPSPTLAMSINGNFTYTHPISAITTTASVHTSNDATSLSTSTETRIATKTITITHSKPSGPNDMSLSPIKELGRLTDKASNLATSKPAEASTVCKAEVLGDQEILIRMPSSIKLSWLSSEALSVNVTRDNETVEIQRVYSSADGIVLQFPREAAHGLLNISIMTTKKPKINETFNVDFGSSWQQRLQLLLVKFSTQVHEDIKNIDARLGPVMTQVWSWAEATITRSWTESESGRQRIEEASIQARHHAVESVSRLTELAKSFSMDLAKRSAILSKEVSIHVSQANERLSHRFYGLQHIREPLDSALLRAQIRSKLYWLQLQGRQAEYQEYEKRAAQITRRRKEDAVRAGRLTEEQMRKAKRAARKIVKGASKTRAGKKCGKVEL